MTEIQGMTDFEDIIQDMTWYMITYVWPECKIKIVTKL